jgi:hypothetical protein
MQPLLTPNSKASRRVEAVLALIILTSAGVSIARPLLIPRDQGATTGRFATARFCPPVMHSFA